tara:strand:+ start:292 stop:687 length:396 start_codon:yes stop_codon:yes gene_type:complete
MTHFCGEPIQGLEKTNQSKSTEPKMAKSIEYELLVWIGCYSQVRSIGYFDITNSKSMRDALDYFKESHKTSIEENEDGRPYVSVYKWIEDTNYEYGDSVEGGYWDTFNALPKYIQKLIKPLLEYQSTIEYI